MLTVFTIQHKHSLKMCFSTYIASRVENRGRISPGNNGKSMFTVFTKQHRFSEDVFLNITYLSSFVEGVHQGIIIPIQTNDVYYY